MNFYKLPHKYYCGIDLHSRTMYLCIVGRDGVVLLHRSLPCDRDRFLLTIAPYREDLVVAVECVYSWYWLADLCAREGIAFVLGHALYMRLIHGAKAKSDRVDSEKTAMLLRGGLMPRAYAYPSDMRATRDLMRRRLLFVRQRGSLLAHIQITHHQYNVDPPGKRITYRSNREGLGEGLEDPSVRHSIAADLALADHYEVIIGELELAVLRQARIHDPNAFALLTSVPGIGKVLALTILYEIHDISRFPSVRDFASYSRLVKCERSSAGKSLGSGGNKIGNAYLKWPSTTCSPASRRSTRSASPRRSRVVPEERGEPFALLEPLRVEPDCDASPSRYGMSRRGHTGIVSTNTRQRSLLDWTPSRSIVSIAVIRSSSSPLPLTRAPHILATGVTVSCDLLIRLTPQTPRDSVRRYAPGVSSVVARVRKLFGDEAACRQYLARSRWPEGLRCPRCQHDDALELPARLLWRCRRCGYDTSVTAGTVLHRTKLPLTQWFWAAYLVSTQTPGFSALQLQRQLGLHRYETAWAMLHKLRRAMVHPDREPLKDRVEVDETYIGGPEAGLRGGRQIIDKAIVVGAVEVRGRASGRVRLKVVRDISARTLVRFVTTNVAPGAVVLTDGFGSYDPLPTMGYRHRARVQATDPRMAARILPRIHRLFGNLKTWLRGTHHGVGHPHLQAYLDEFTFRFNRRRTPMAAFQTLVGLGSLHQPTTYNQLYRVEPNG